LGSAQEESLGTVTAAETVPGPWVIPDEVYTLADPQWVDYEGAGPWDDGIHCASAFKPGVAVIIAYLKQNFSGISSIGGLNCAPGVAYPDQMGMHGTGRAIDIMIPTEGGDADNGSGDPIANFLITNAELLGMQYLIWDQWKWSSARAPGEHDGPYTGSSNPHTNHLHVEFYTTQDIMHSTTNWFEDDAILPVETTCPVASAGAVIDDADPCVIFRGNPDYWRHEDGIGYQGGGLHWTNAWDSAVPGNWAKWPLSFDEAGSYSLEIYLDPAYAVASGVRYEVKHASGQDLVYIDQSSGNGWTSLGTPGTFDFSEGGEQWIAVYDDQLGVASDQHIAVDALRITREGEPPDASAPDASPEAEPADGSPPEEGGNDSEAGDAPSAPPIQEGGSAYQDGGAADSSTPESSVGDSWDSGEEGGCEVRRLPADVRGAALGSLALLFALGCMRRIRHRCD
jgi:hypothetical protein